MSVWVGGVMGECVWMVWVWVCGCLGGVAMPSMNSDYTPARDI